MVQRLLDTDRDRNQDLIDALRKGDGNSLQELIRRNDRWVRGIVYSVLGAVDGLDDVVQEVWLSAWRQIGSLEDAAKWRGWLARLAQNSAIDALRKRSRRKKYIDRFKELFEFRRKPETTPEARLELEDEHRFVLRAIKELPEIYRQVFVLRHLEDCNYRTIAETLTLPVATVETRLVRARRMLRASLAQRSAK